MGLGSSTCGTQAIEQALLALSADSPGIAIVQHMPEKFTAMYAQRLDTLCAVIVRKARDGDRLERGMVLIATGGRHLRLRKAGGQHVAVVMDGPPSRTTTRVARLRVGARGGEYRDAREAEPGHKQS